MEASSNCENDNVLFDLLRQGDEVAFGKIYKLHWVELYNAAYKRLPEKEKCQDIIQNVFADLWNRKAELDLQNPLAYLHTAVRFQVLKQFHKSNKHNLFNLTFEQKLISPLQTDGDLLEKEVRVLIELFIKALPEKRRKIFLLHYFEGLSTAKISVELNVSQKTVQNQLTTATHALRFKLTHMFLILLAAYFSFLK
ncbi:RNA polymerase sigma factor [Pedobacter aquatilis]|uniref:RNA polymerase sigma factor n=1 Tax=Pedobacter aquatilis TaxID=351343 RepID=UPI00292FE3B0|nr:sigma-70 family RNA polymerase sigma factor [Pedobacter aquatilis]